MLGYHLVKYVFMLGQREVRRDGWVVFVVGFMAWIVIVLAGYETLGAVAIRRADAVTSEREKRGWVRGRLHDTSVGKRPRST